MRLGYTNGHQRPAVLVRDLFKHLVWSKRRGSSNAGLHSPEEMRRLLEYERVRADRSKRTLSVVVFFLPYTDADLAVSVRTACGAWLVIQHVSLPVTRSMEATLPHVSMGDGCDRG